MRERSAFTLIEMAVVLVVVGLIILTVFPALTALRSNSQRSLTQSNLQALLEATAAYVQANGCLPCPTRASARGADFGRIRGNASTAACGNCPNPEGITPFASLGIPASLARDGWGHWITMRVDPALTLLPSNPPTCNATNSCSTFVPPSAPCLAVPDVMNGVCTSAQVGSAAKGMCRLNIPASERIAVQIPFGSSQQAAVIFVSHGSRGFGAFRANVLGDSFNGTRVGFPSSIPACSTPQGYARCNADDNLEFFDAAPAQDLYDDMMIYADRNTLVSHFGNASCQTVW